MFDPLNYRASVLDQLQSGRIYKLRLDLASDQEPYPRGTEFRFDYAIVNLASQAAEIHGFDAGGRRLVFWAQGQEHLDWFEQT